MRLFNIGKRDAGYSYTWPKGAILNALSKYFRIEVVSDQDDPDGKIKGHTFVKVYIDDNFAFVLMLIGQSPERRIDIRELLFGLTITNVNCPRQAIDEINQRTILAHVTIDGGNVILFADVKFPESFSEKMLLQIMVAWLKDVKTLLVVLERYNQRRMAFIDGVKRFSVCNGTDANLPKLKSFKPLRQNALRQVERFRVL